MNLPFPARKAAALAAVAFTLGSATSGRAGEGYALGARDCWSWGTTTSAFVALRPAQGHPADVVFINRLTHGNSIDMIFVLEIDGLSVDVEVNNGVGEQPDIITVTAPPGFIAVPSTIEVREGETGRIQIHQALLS
ncbi:hypothetical protein [Rubellimicrobium arenae]|uniref:hypothetical protein n=1 Tax=Rubellimicrobium arenae TaxID=2817372 RepID=UPI001B30FF23|nr:hypothetical protein [Rubellimicrobium arenae]